MWSPAPARRDHDEELRGLAARRGDGAQAALQAGHALLEGRHGRVGDAAVDVPELLQREQRGGVQRVLEHEAGRLVDGHGAGARRRVRAAAGVHGARAEAVPFVARSGGAAHDQQRTGPWRAITPARTGSTAPSPRPGRARPSGRRPRTRRRRSSGAWRRASAASRSANRHASTPWTRRWSSRRSSIRARAGPSSPAAMAPTASCTSSRATPTAIRVSCGLSWSA